MSNTNAKDLNISRTEALQGLLRSLGRANDDLPSSGATVSTEQLQKLSEKINEILGDGGDDSLKPGDQPSQLLSEDGLPIVDISEPTDEGLQASASSPPVPEHDLIPLSLLPPAEKELRRRERDRILDLLEEEERLQQLQEERDAREERRDAIRKRKESELHRLREAQELQKKMGRALVRHAKGTQESGEEDARSKSRTTSSASKKSVSFADAPIMETNESNQQAPAHQPDYDLGDVSLGRLRAQNRVPLVSMAEAQGYPMKMHVVERHPVATSSSSHNADSDDGSTSSAAHLSPPLEDDSSDEDKSLASDTLSDDAPLEGEFDYDVAQHHREIALEYHKKRHAIGAETAKVMAADIPDDHDQPEIPKGQTPLSRFRADRMAVAYDKSHGSISTSIGQNVIPASRQKSLQTSVRLGKLEKDQLVGGESGESGSEDEAAREVIEMLKAGNIQNIGPDFNPSSISGIAPPRNPDIMDSQPTGMPNVAKPSRFKLARGGGMETTTFEDSINGDSVQSRPTISSVVERKASKSSSRQHFPINKPPPRARVKPSEHLPPMIIDSPSFPMIPTSSFSPAIHPVTTVPPSLPLSLYQTHLKHPPPSVNLNLSVTQDSTMQYPAPTQTSLSVERPISKFMTERKNRIE